MRMAADMVEILARLRRLRELAQAAAGWRDLARHHRAICGGRDPGRRGGRRRRRAWRRYAACRTEWAACRSQMRLIEAALRRLRGEA